MTWTWIGVLAGEGAAIWVDTTAMTGAETGARAGVGTATGEGREAETGIWTGLVVTWTGGLTETGAKAGAGAFVCIWTEAAGKGGGGLRVCVWTWG